MWMHCISVKLKHLTSAQIARQSAEAEAAEVLVVFAGFIACVSDVLCFAVGVGATSDAAHG